MKTRFFLPIILLVSFTLLNFTNRAFDDEVSDTPSVTWNETIHDFGDVKQHNPAKTKFELKNSGLIPVIIASVTAPCGCTVPKYSKKPILPGEKSTITVTYNSKAPGPFRKSIVVKFNDQEINKTLYIKGTVVKNQ